MPGEENPIDVNALVTLGPERLATLLAEAAMMNLCMRRRLQFELSAQKNENIPEAVHRWISELSEQTSFLNAEQSDELARELEAMRAAIVSNVSRAALKLAPDLMWQFFTLARTVYERTTEEGWEVSRVFDQACADLVKMSVDAEIEPKLFAAKVVSAISSNHYGEYSALIPAIASAQPWASAYVSEIRALLQRLLDEPPGPNGSTNSERSRVLRRLTGTRFSFCSLDRLGILASMPASRGETDSLDVRQTFLASLPKVVGCLLSNPQVGTPTIFDAQPLLQT